MKTQFAVACSMAKHDGLEYVHTITLHVNWATSAEEAKGLAIGEAMKMKPGFALVQVIAIEVSNG